MVDNYKESRTCAPDEGTERDRLRNLEKVSHYACACVLCSTGPAAPRRAFYLLKFLHVFNIYFNDFTPENNNTYIYWQIKTTYKSDDYE